MATILARVLEVARNREYADDHLSEQDREALVRRYRQEHPQEELPDDVLEAYIRIIFN